MKWIIFLIALPIVSSCAISPVFLRKIEKNNSQIIQIADTIFKQNKMTLNQWITYCRYNDSVLEKTAIKFHNKSTLAYSSNNILIMDSIQSVFLLKTLRIDFIESVEELSCPYSKIYADSIVTFSYPGLTYFPKIGKEHLLVVDMRVTPRDSLINPISCYFKNSFKGYRKISPRIFYVTDPYELFLGS
jgi:hypothetical protein